MTHHLRSRVRVLAVCAVLSLSAAAVLADDGYNMWLDGAFGVEQNPDLHHAIATIQGIGCSGGCGYINVEINWDDGTVDSFSGDESAFYFLNVDHYYGTGGLYHASISIDDDLGNWLVTRTDLDVTW